MDAYQDYQQPCMVSHHDSASNNINYADYFELPPECQAGETSKALVATEPEYFSPEHITLEQAKNKILKFRANWFFQEKRYALS